MKFFNIEKVIVSGDVEISDHLNKIKIIKNPCCEILCQSHFLLNKHIYILHFYVFKKLKQ